MFDASALLPDIRKQVDEIGYLMRGVRDALEHPTDDDNRGGLTVDEARNLERLADDVHQVAEDAPALARDVSAMRDTLADVREALDGVVTASQANAVLLERIAIVVEAMAKASSERAS